MAFERREYPDLFRGTRDAGKIVVNRDASRVIVRPAVGTPDAKAELRKWGVRVCAPTCRRLHNAMYLTRNTPMRNAVRSSSAAVR